MRYQYDLSLAGTHWKVQIPIHLDPGPHCTAFMTEHGRIPDIELNYEIGWPCITGYKIRDQYPRVHDAGDCYYVERERVCSFCSCVEIKKQPERSYKGWIYPGKEKNFSLMDSLLAVSEMEILLASVDAFSLHSSLIRTDGRAVLFTAPSGTGKSTQAELWRDYRNADIINGDRSLIRKSNGRWTAFGSPFAGSSEIYRNENAPIQCIVVLRQSTENEIRKLSPAQAFRSLYSETVIPRWIPEVHGHMMDLLESIAGEIPVVLFHCTPDREAVEILDEYLQKETE